MEGGYGALGGDPEWETSHGRNGYLAGDVCNESLPPMLRRSRPILLVSAVLLFGMSATVEASGQGLRGHLGASGFTVIGGEQAGDRSAFLFPTAGLVVQRGLPISGALSVEVGLFYVGKGATSEGTALLDNVPIPATTELRLAYLDIPLVLRAELPIAPGLIFSVIGGPVFEFLLDEGLEIRTEDGPSTGVLAGDNFRSSSFAGQVGLGVAVERFEVGVRYHRSLGSAASDDAIEAFRDVRHSGVLLLVSYQL